MNIRYRAMQTADLDAVAALEARCHSAPWSRQNFADALAADNHAWLATEDDATIGYAIVLLVQDEASLLNITIAAELQRSGRGGALLAHICALARAQGAERMFLEVRASNRAALALYRRHGFIEQGRRRNYYACADGAREDAIVMRCEL
ncbi:MAG TPA: ribosomal protein S18-alanine N-acetyltransferase [Rhodocyclaceae bacterium]|nr:ribosomal protein S18-alanine N-acetyltransferase [Rhodocyclaceae bacterium]